MQVVVVVLQFSYLKVRDGPWVVVVFFELILGWFVVLAWSCKRPLGNADAMQEKERKLERETKSNELLSFPSVFVCLLVLLFVVCLCWSVCSVCLGFFDLGVLEIV